MYIFKEIVDKTMSMSCKLIVRFLFVDDANNIEYCERLKFQVDPLDSELTEAINNYITVRNREDYPNS